MKALLTIIVVIAALFFFGEWVSWTKRVPHNLKLTECTNSTLNISFICPTGSGFDIFLGVPRVTNLVALNQMFYKGHVSLFENNHEIYSQIFNSANGYLPYWIDQKENIAGYSLTIPDGNNLSFGKVLRPSFTYSVRIVFDQPINGESSIWLCWKQSKKEVVEN